MDFFLMICLVTIAVYGVYYGLLLLDFVLRGLLVVLGTLLLSTVYYAAVGVERLFNWIDRRWLS